MALSTLVLFDIDGTILLTSGAGRRAITAALAAEVGAADGFDRVRGRVVAKPRGVLARLSPGRTTLAQPRPARASISVS